MIHCTNSFTTQINLETKEVIVLMNETLNHSLCWLVQYTDAFRSDYPKSHALRVSFFQISYYFVAIKKLLVCVCVYIVQM